MEMEEVWVHVASKRKKGSLNLNSNLNSNSKNGKDRNGNVKGKGNAASNAPQSSSKSKKGGHFKPMDGGGDNNIDETTVTCESLLVELNHTRNALKQSKYFPIVCNRLRYLNFKIIDSFSTLSPATPWI